MSSLSGPLPVATKTEIIHQFWGSQPDLEIPEAYWSFFDLECEWGLRNISHAWTPRDLIETVTSLKSGHLRHETQKLLRQKLTNVHENELELIDKTIDLCARLLLMIDFYQYRAFSFTDRRMLIWTSGTLQACVSLGFSRKYSLEHKNIKLERTFNAESLEKYAGIRVEPTTNLLDHLRLYDDDTLLHIFHQASFLKHQAQE